MIRIRSKRHLFRRCGMAHPKQPVDYPDDRFSEKEIERLKAESMLIVESFDLEALDRAIPDETEGQAEEGTGESPQGSDEALAIDAEADAATNEADVALGESAPVVDFNEWTVKQLTELLEKRGIEIPKKARKAELIDLIKAG